MPRVLRLAVFQYLPFFSNALPLAPIGALGIGVLPKTHPTIIYRQIAFGAAIGPRVWQGAFDKTDRTEIPDLRGPRGSLVRHQDEQTRRDQPSSFEHA